MRKNKRALKGKKVVGGREGHLLFYFRVSEWVNESCSAVPDSLRPIQSMEFSRPEYWSGLPFLLQGIFPTQVSNPGLPHCRQILLPAEPQRQKTSSILVDCSFSIGNMRSDSLSQHGCPTSRDMSSFSLLTDLRLFFFFKELEEGTWMVNAQSSSKWSFRNLREITCASRVNQG